MPRTKVEVPQKILRWVWFFILEYFKSNPNDFKIDDDDTTDYPELASHITKSKVSSPTIEDPDEKDWVTKGKLSYPFVYAIPNTYKARICTPIGIRAETFNPTPGTRPQKGGQVQQQLIKLSPPAPNIFHAANLKLSVAHVRALFTFARSIAKKQDKKTEEGILEFLEKEFGKIAGTQQPPRKPAQKPLPSDLIQVNFWKKEIQSAFFADGNLWRFYERITLEEEDQPQIGPKHGFMVNAVRFYKNSTGQTYCQMANTYIGPGGDHVDGFYYGPATISGENPPHLHIHLYDGKRQHPSFFVLRLGDIIDQRIMVGFYISFSRTRNKYLCKTIVFERIIDPNTLIGNLWDEGDMSFIEKELRKYTELLKFKDNPDRFKIVPTPVQSFLENRLLNRLSMPSQQISVLKQLERWVVNKHKIEDEGKLEDFCTRYVVAYCFSDMTEKKMTDGKFEWEKVRFDTLKISRHKFKPLYFAQYHHHSMGIDTVYEGEVYRKGQNIELLIFQPYESRRATVERNCGLLNFHVPESQFKAIEAQNYFSGILSGLGDSPVKPVAYRVMVFTRAKLLEDQKKEADIANIDEENRALIIDFFRTHRESLFISDARDE